MNTTTTETAFNDNSGLVLNITTYDAYGDINECEELTIQMELLALTSTDR